MRLLVIAFLVSGAFFLLLCYGGDMILNSYYTDEYQQQKNHEYIEKMQKEIDEKNLSTKDTDAILRWVKDQRVISVQIYKNDKLVFDSEYPDVQEILDEEAEINYYDWQLYYELTFKDGAAYVSVFGLYQYQMMTYMTITWLFLSFILFFCIVILGIRRTISYIQTLCEEIGILEGGDLDYEITVNGKNELSGLAKGLDDMRKAFKEKTENEARIVKANKKLITEMSHDLRTPLTSLMIYSELLSQGKYDGERQARKYADKINKKTLKMKQLTDHLFEYALLSENDTAKADLRGSVRAVFYDALSDVCAYLEQKGFDVSFESDWKERKVCVSEEYISRIFDNIASNIVKYADAGKKVSVSAVCGDRGVDLRFENACADKNEAESNHIGIGNIKSMMDQMKGICRIYNDNNIFNISLYFPYI